MTDVSSLIREIPIGDMPNYGSKVMAAKCVAVAMGLQAAFNVPFEKAIKFFDTAIPGLNLKDNPPSVDDAHHVLGVPPSFYKTFSKLVYLYENSDAAKMLAEMINTGPTQTTSHFI